MFITVDLNILSVIIIRYTWITIQLAYELFRRNLILHLTLLLLHYFCITLDVMLCGVKKCKQMKRCG